MRRGLGTLIALVVMGVTPALAEDACSLAGAYVAGTVSQGIPVVVRFAFLPPADCAGRGDVTLSAEGHEGTTVRYQVTADGEVLFTLPWFPDGSGPLVLRGTLADAGFAFAGSGLAGTALPTTP